MDAIIAYDLSKKYGSITALNGLNLEVPEGSVFSIIGSPNCGKTTALRIFAGLLLPDGGECSVMACSPYYEPQKAHTLTGVVTDTAKMYKAMTVSQNLSFFASINNVERNDAIDRISFLLHRLDIWEHRDSLVRDLPTNALQKANLARALIHSPKLLLMDEPTEGLDQETTETVRDMVGYINREEGTTTLVCSRHAAHAEMICSHFAIMDSGELIAKGDIEALRKRSGLKPKAALRLAEGSAAPNGFVLRDGFWEKSIESENEMPELIMRTIKNGCNLFEAKIINPQLKDIYQKFISGRQEAGEEVAEYDGEIEEEFAENTEEADGADESGETGGAEPEYAEEEIQDMVDG